MKRLQLLPEFFFLDGRGAIRSLRDYLGDFTVLAFTTGNGTGTDLTAACGLTVTGRYSEHLIRRSASEDLFSLSGRNRTAHASND